MHERVFQEDRLSVDLLTHCIAGDSLESVHVFAAAAGSPSAADTPPSNTHFDVSYLPKL